MVKAWAGRSIAAAAAEALVKIGAVVPEDRMRAAQRVPVFALGTRLQDSDRDNLDALGKAIDGRLKVCFAYCDAEGSGSRRTVRPLALHFWGQVWTLAAWCELRDDFRTFRVDRVEGIELTEERYEREAGKTLEDYLARITRAP
jgi:predicted DNA-binding transcriptional regulator YafY